MTEDSKVTIRLKPLFFGRLTRVVLGLAALTWGVGLWKDDLAVSLLAILVGLSFLVGGVMANPGCEITALINLLLPAEKRLYSP